MNEVLELGSLELQKKESVLVALRLGCPFDELVGWLVGFGVSRLAGTY